MKSSNQFINESVFNINLKYSKLQNKTKELFFKCLDEGRTLKYFEKELIKIWGNLDHNFLENELDKYTELIHEYNTRGKIVEEIPKEDWNILFALVPLSVFLKQEQRFVKIKEKEYKSSLKSYAYKNDKEDYLKLKVQRYTNQIVPYYDKHGGVSRYVQLSTYESMLHNTNLTRSGWNTTLNDADSIGNQLFYIPYHPFSCLHCLEHQNKIYTKEDIINMVGFAEEAEGDILHPNCKCMLTMYENTSQFNKPQYSEAQLQEQYDIRQKVNSLTLKKEEILTDIKIQKSLGNEDEVDLLNNQRNKINREIRDLKEELPTTSLKKQLTAISR